MLVWISLRLLPLEYLEFVCSIAGQIRRVLEEDKNVIVTQDPCFCVKLEVDKGWIATLKLPNLLGCKVELIIDYKDHMCCTLCFDTNHGFADCLTLGPSVSQTREHI